MLRTVTLWIGTAIDVLHRGGLDVGGRAHAGTQPHGAVGDADLHLEVRDLLLRAGVVGSGGAGDLAHDAGDLAVGIGVDADAGHPQQGVLDLADLDAEARILTWLSRRPRNSSLPSGRQRPKSPRGRGAGPSRCGSAMKAGRVRSGSLT